MINKLLFIAILFLLISCNNNSGSDYDSSLPVPKSNNIEAPAPIMFSVDAVYPHDPQAFTQGLEFYKGKLYEGTGEYKQSSLRIVDIKTGKVEKEYKIPDSSVFGEGITIFKNKIYQLTWQSNKIFVYSLNDITHPISTFNWSRQGWGATNDGNQIIISDGSSKLFFVQPDENRKEMKINKILTVVNNRGEVDSLNELELIDGSVYANRWLTDDIEKIDTSNGHVTGVLHLQGLLSQYDPGVKVSDGAVLNGIAYDSATKKLYITGKDWPKLFEMKLN
ncbi:MAG: glutaminyl-peptide cyclotransferase [Bacteroidota bacterium]|jgi:glutaminyl-peptide cyclotransferase|nr:glutaminyl-peptide cyclotransferase [Bacteroidota bacterium]